MPASAQSQQHPIADGPYTVQSYTPARTITYVRNPVWQASTDPIRKAYVDKIVVTETGNQQTNQQQLQTNTASASMEWDSFPPLAAVPGLVSQMQAGANHNFNLGPTYSTNPFIWFNSVSPNNGSALSKVAVRQALSYGLNRAHLTQVINPTVNPPLTHVLPDGINGAQDVPSGYNPYPYNVSKAKSLLASAGYPNGLSITLLYPPSSSIRSAIAQAAQSDLAKIGVKVKLLGVPSADLLTKYLEVPSVAKRGVWDLALTGWGPDWYGDAALSFFGPLFSGPPSYPPVGSNFGFYNNPSVTALIGQAATSGSAFVGRDDLGAGGPEGHAGRAVLPDHPAAAAAVSRQLRAQRRVRAGHPAVRPDERLAELARQLTGRSGPGWVPAARAGTHPGMDLAGNGDRGLPWRTVPGLTFGGSDMRTAQRQCSWREG